MAGPEPTERLLAVREALRSGAIPDITRRLGVAEGSMVEVSGWAERDLLSALGAVDPQQVGWVLVSAGTILARNADDLVAPVADNPDEALATGVMWASLVVAEAGDALTREASVPSRPEGTTGIDPPSATADELRVVGDALVGEMLGVLGPPTATRGPRRGRGRPAPRRAPGPRSRAGRLGPEGARRLVRQEQ